MSYTWGMRFSSDGNLWVDVNYHHEATAIFGMTSDKKNNFNFVYATFKVEENKDPIFFLDQTK